MYIRDQKTSLALVADRKKLDYFHQGFTKVSCNTTAYSAYCSMTNDCPAWLQTAFWIRDKFSSLAKVESIQGFNNKVLNAPPKVGEKLDFFDVLKISKEELLLISSDRHLSVLIAINISIDERGDFILKITASVKNKNLFGYLYMLPVKPAHAFIVNKMLDKVRY